jgi:lipopolysaccharide biosynthesis regulator YciM
MYIIAGGAALLLIVAAVVLFRGKKKAPSSQEHYIGALRDVIDGRREQAFGKLQQAVKSGSAPTDAYIKLGRLLRENGEARKAVQLHQSLTVKTNLSKNERIELFLNLAEDYAAIGDSQKSVQVLESAIKQLNIHDPKVYLSLSKHYHLLGQRERAYETLRDAKRCGAIGERELALYLSSSAEALLNDGEAKNAKKLLHQALKHDESCAYCRLILGNIAETENHLDQAIDEWKRVALLSPELAEPALHKLERSLFERGRFGDIEKIYQDVRGARVGDEAANLSLAAFYKKQGRSEEAIRLLEEYLGGYPESTRGALLLTSLYARYRDGETTERYLDGRIEDSMQPLRFKCDFCGYQSDSMRWHCPQCNAFDSFSTDHAS